MPTLFIFLPNYHSFTNRALSYAYASFSSAVNDFHISHVISTCVWGSVGNVLEDTELVCDLHEGLETHPRDENRMRTSSLYRRSRGERMSRRQGRTWRDRNGSCTRLRRDFERSEACVVSGWNRVCGGLDDDVLSESPLSTSAGGTLHVTPPYWAH